MYMVHPEGIECGVMRLSDQAWIPNCEDNSDWKRYLLWVAEGNEAVLWSEEEEEE